MPYRPVVCLRRGHLGQPLRTPKFNLLGSVDDLNVQMAAIRRRYPAARVVGFAESAGTGLAVRYAGEMGEQNPLDAFVCVCPGYDTTEGGAFSRCAQRPSHSSEAEGPKKKTVGQTNYYFFRR